MSAVITPDPSLNLSEEIADYFSYLIQSSRPSVPPLSIPQILLTSIRSGLSAEVLTSSIVSRLTPEANIPTGPLGQGTPNSIEIMIKIICEEIVSALQNDARLDVAINSGVPITATGGNSGGPVQSVGASTAPYGGQAVIR